MAKKEDERLIEGLREQLDRKDRELEELRGRINTERERANDYDEAAQAAKAQEESYRRQLAASRAETKIAEDKVPAAEAQMEKARDRERAVRRMLAGKSNEVHRLSMVLHRIADWIKESEGEKLPDYAELVERIDDEVRPVLSIEDPDEKAIAAGRRLLEDLDLRADDDVAKGIGRHLRSWTTDLGEVQTPLRMQSPGYFRGEPTAEGYRFERLGGDINLDEWKKLLERAVAAEERRDELQALVDELIPHIETLVSELAGSDPAWWVKATRALGELDRWGQSILATPPSR